LMLVLSASRTFGQVAKKSPRAIESMTTSNASVRFVKRPIPSLFTIYIIRLLIGVIR
jgi:hypothetical protein